MSSDNITDSGTEEKRVEVDNKIHPVVSFTKEDIGTDHVLTTYISPDGKEVKVTGDVDQAMALALQAEQNHVEYDPVADKKLLKKIDTYLLPLLCFLYACQFMDKVTNGSAAVLGLRTDLHMQGTMYSWTGTSFYLGYLAFEFPANAILQRFPVAKATAFFIIVWGAILCLHSTPKYAGFIVLRTLLGAFESTVSPAMVIITGQWYRKEEQFFRTSIWFCFNGLGIIMGSAIAYGCAVHGDKYSMEAWKVLFIVTGLMTIAVGFMFLFHIPDDPSGAWFLTAEEKLMVVARIRTNKQGFGNKHFKKYQFIEALKDPLTWLYFFLALATNIPNGSMTNFGAILLNSDFGYSPKDALLMNMPTGAVEIVGCAGLGYLHHYVPHRMILSLASIFITLIASCLLAFPHSNNAKLSGMYLQAVAPICMICALSCFQSNTAGHTKKVTTTAIYLIGYCVGNLIGPQTFIAAQAPSYTGGKIAIVVCYAVSLLIIGAIYWIYYKRNVQRDKKIAEMDLSEFKAIQNSEFADLTDMENPTFRYCL